jgi:cyclic pyranopterin phosphate synthase
MPAKTNGDEYHFLPRAEILTFEEIVRLTRILVDLGVSKVRITGGEPLLRSQIEILIGYLANIKGIEDLALTTNGYLLAQKARVLRDAGLGRVTVSLHSLHDDVFAHMNGRGYSTESVLEGIRVASEVGLTPIKINIVVQRGVNSHTIVELARFFKRLGHIPRFIEYMDVGNLNGWNQDQVMSADEIVKTISAELRLEPIEKKYSSEVALRFRYKDGDGEIGIIASVTKPFCGDCARLRLSAEGKLYTCLFASEGHDVKGDLRAGATDNDIKEILRDIWGDRTDRYSEERAALMAGESIPRKVEMYQLGG